MGMGRIARIMGPGFTDRISGWVCSSGQYLRQSDAPDLAKRLRQSENTGRPLGDKPFVTHPGKAIGRDLQPRKPGRKPKSDRK